MWDWAGREFRRLISMFALSLNDSKGLTLLGLIGLVRLESRRFIIPRAFF